MKYYKIQKNCSFAAIVSGCTLIPRQPRACFTVSEKKAGSSLTATTGNKSCVTTNQNPTYNVIILATYGSFDLVSGSEINVTVHLQGVSAKPLVLVLVSAEIIYWKLNVESYSYFDSINLVSN